MQYPAEADEEISPLPTQPSSASGNFYISFAKRILLINGSHVVLPIGDAPYYRRLDIFDKVETNLESPETTPASTTASGSVTSSAKRKLDGLESVDARPAKIAKSADLSGIIDPKSKPPIVIVSL